LAIHQAGVNEMLIAAQALQETERQWVVDQPKSYSHFRVLGINGAENTLKPPPLLIRQNPTSIRDFLPHRFAKVYQETPV
jgi:hypothetical protein